MTLLDLLEFVLLQVRAARDDLRADRWSACYFAAMFNLPILEKIALGGSPPVTVRERPVQLRVWRF